ncbi:MAG: ComEC family competence protein [Dysgonamonadaceae bacterium]|jgi:competence protein ComEC|nr:ComEC family competence protein [Dysgonamonadaceae bacterium]
MILQTFRQAPFLRLLLALIAGILLQFYSDCSAFAGGILTFAAGLLLLCTIPKIRKSYACRHFFGIGIFLISFVLGIYLTKKTWLQSEWMIEGEHSYLVRLTDDPVAKPKSRMCKAEILSANESVVREVVNTKVLLYIPNDSASSRLTAGQCLLIRASLEKPNSFPGADFDYPLYLRRQGYGAVGFVKYWQRDDRPVPCNQFLWFESLKLRNRLFVHLRELLPDSHSFALAAALMFGYTHAMDKDLRQSFAHIGAGHILAVSGLHFNLIFGAAYFLLSFLGRGMQGKIIRQLILLPCIWGFAFLTGLSPSVLRAACMLSLWGIGDALFYRPFTLNTVAATAFFLLLYYPFYLWDIGFQLSFIAVVSIVIINPVIVRLYPVNNPMVKYVWDLIAVSLSAQIGVFPLSIYYFHQFPMLFLLTNLLLIPLSGILLLLIPVSLLCQLIFGTQAWLAFPLRELLSLFISITQSLDRIPGGNIAGLYLDVSETILCYIGLGFIVYLFVRRRMS